MLSLDGLTLSTMILGHSMQTTRESCFNFGIVPKSELFIIELI